MKSTTKKPRVGLEQAEKLREAAELLDQLGHRGRARQVRSIADLIAPEPSALRQQDATYVYRLFLLLLPRGNGSKIKAEVGRLYDYTATSVPVTASRNKAHGDRRIKRLLSGDNTLSTKRIVEELEATIPEGKRLRLLTAKQNR